MSDFLRNLLIETIQNIPLWMGFIIGARLYERSKTLGAGVLFGCMALGAFLIATTEHIIIGGQSRLITNPQTLLANIVMFCAVGALFLAYFTSDHPLIDYRSDIALGVLVAVLIAVVQGMTTAVPVGEAINHGLALGLAIVVTLVVVRVVLSQESLRMVVAQAFALTLIASVIITLVDYTINT